VRERRALLQRLADDLSGRDPAQMAVCDVGCGSGSDLAYWRDLGVEEARLAGTELLADRAAAARAALPAADIRLVDSYELPFDSNQFALTTASLVFSLIKSAEDRAQLFREMSRVTEPGGAVAIYDFRVRKPTNREVVALTAPRVRALSGSHPDAVWSAGPFLPLLPLALAMPPPVGTLLLRALPRTHALYAWRR
jgi:ubiquinone/menaquinone biosynthesis C-methylase UbiE